MRVQNEDGKNIVQREREDEDKSNIKKPKKIKKRAGERP